MDKPIDTKMTDAAGRGFAGQPRGRWCATSPCDMAYIAGQWCREHGIAPITAAMSRGLRVRINGDFVLQIHYGKGGTYAVPV